MILDLDLGRTIKKLNVCITFSFLYNNVNVWPIEKKKQQIPRRESSRSFYK